MSFYLAFKEIIRNKSRYLLFSLVIALITVLVLFIAGLAEGLGNANREFLSKIDAQLIVFQDNVKLSTTASRIGRSTLLKVRRIPGVADVGPVGLSSATLINPTSQENIDISLVGVAPGKPGAAPALVGRNLYRERAYETVIDGNLAAQAGLKVGDQITIKTIQGTKDEFYDLTVIGITDGQQYFFQPSIFVTTEIWNKIRPQADPSSQAETAYNIFAVRLSDPNTADQMAALIQNRVDNVEVVDKVTAYEATPGYQAQQNTLNTQQGFTLLIGILVIGGFFQIQTLQKVPNIGMLKAVGASNPTVGAAVVMQIIVVTLFGVLLGSLGTLGLAMSLPGGIPIVFSGNSIVLALVSLLLIGPVGGLVSVRLALKVEPLMALGLSS